MKLFVAGLPNDFDDIDLKEMFELYGEVISSKLIVDKVTQKSKGFGFVEMSDKIEAQQTIEALNGVSIKGKKISVQRADDKQKAGGYRRNSDDRFNKRY